MLVFTRKPGESFKIGDNCLVTIKEVRGSKVILGFDAPKTVKIERTDRKIVESESGDSDATK